MLDKARFPETGKLEGQLGCGRIGCVCGTPGERSSKPLAAEVWNSEERSRLEMESGCPQHLKLCHSWESWSQDRAEDSPQGTLPLGKVAGETEELIKRIVGGSILEAKAGARGGDGDGEVLSGRS